MLRSRFAAILLVLALVGTLGPPIATAPPAEAATGTGACASHLVPATAFTDTLTSTHRAAIDCSSWWGLFRGTSPTTFTPAANVTRGQTAAVIARLLRTTGRAPAAVPSAGFTDTVGNTFEADIDLLAYFGIVRGFTPTTFGPSLPIKRAHMAAIISRTFTLAYASPLPTGPVPFTDVPRTSPYYDAIGQLLAAKITYGTSPTTFSPDRPVLRGEMASFVTRSTDVLLTRGLARYPTARPGSNDAYASRMRGAWVHLFDGTLKTTTGVRRMVDELAAADVNVIIAQVARRHDAYYPSTVLPRTTDPAVAPDFDLITTLTTAARARGIEVHAWFAIAPTYHPVYASIPAPSPNWIYTEHGRLAPVAARWVTRTYSGTWTDYLDPGVPQVQDHVARVVGELARKGVDGIHLDYVRYDGADQGYNPLALAAFRTATGRTDTPAPTDAQWTRWRRDQTRQLVRRAKAAIAATGRPVELSAAVITWGDGPATPDRAGFVRTSPYTRALQDWDAWVRDGELDAVMPMNYFRAHDPAQAAWFARWITYERALAVAATTQVVPGPAGYLNEPANVLSQVRAAMRVDGAMVYSYQQPTLDGSRTVWSRLSVTRWGYSPTR
jgi:uncharacterized lipoprotein YddW (UPF0748 family)